MDNQGLYLTWLEGSRSPSHEIKPVAHKGARILNRFYFEKDQKTG